LVNSLYKVFYKILLTNVPRAFFKYFKLSNDYLKKSNTLTPNTLNTHIFMK